jgi:hypothetical protein
MTIWLSLFRLKRRLRHLRLYLGFRAVERQLAIIREENAG